MATTTPETTSTVQEIDRARADMGQALFVIGDRIAPRKVIARVKEKVKLKASAKAAELKERYSPVEVARRKLGGSDRKVIDTRVSRPGLPR
ncbi:MAG: hypothetical protein ACLGI2_06710 [Acidimicrobiia bacterium]